MKEFWDLRYSEEEYAYGIEPNEFLKHTLQRFSPKGRILLPAEGEGRNAVYAAKRGLEVTAFDISMEGKRKAEKLAEVNKVDVHYLLGDVEELTFEENSFDVVALIFAHFNSEFRSAYHRKLMSFLKPGGLVIFEAFSKNHLKFNMTNPEAGGPKDIRMLLNTEEIKQDFSGFHIIELKEVEVNFNEGKYHKGKSSVIRFLGRKK
jgi:ubiquinone/menaquinone biosynthesis C-methylase UbiE